MTRGQPNWVVISIAHGSDPAERSRQTLEREGFAFQLKPVAHTSSGEPITEVMVLSCEAREARDVLRESGL